MSGEKDDPEFGKPTDGIGHTTATGESPEPSQANPFDGVETSNIKSLADGRPLDSQEGEMPAPDFGAAESPPDASEDTDLVLLPPGGFSEPPNSTGDVFAPTEEAAALSGSEPGLAPELAAAVANDEAREGGREIVRAPRDRVDQLYPRPEDIVTSVLEGYDGEERAPPVVDDADDFDAFESLSEQPAFPPTTPPEEMLEDDPDEDFAFGPDTSVTQLRPAFEPERPKTSIEVTMPGVRIEALEAEHNEVFSDRSNKPVRRLAQRLLEQRRLHSNLGDDLELDIDVEFDEPPAPAPPPKTGHWKVNTQVTGRVDVDLTHEIWTGERLPHGQEHAVPKASELSEADIFEVERELSQGKHGTVFLAHLPEIEDPVALKILHQELSHSLKERQRFRREIRAHAALEHPNIVRVLKYGRRKGRYFLATELLEGSLRDVIESISPLPTAVVAFLLEDILKGIQYAHLRQVVHREIKPSNLLFAENGALKIGDFGFAKSSLDPNESTPGAVLGSTAYMSPEQAQGDPIGPRSDLFAIASVAYEMCTGVNPYDRGNDVDNLSAVRRGDAHELAFIRPDAHPHLSQLIAELGEPDRADRPDSAYEALKRLWPLARMVQKRYPKLREQFVKAPRKIAKQLRLDEARLEKQRGDRILEARGGGGTAAAFLAYYRSWALDPQKETKEGLDAIARDSNYSYDENWVQTIQERVDQPHPVEPLMWEEMATEARLRGRVWDAFRYLRRYVRLRPLDHVAQATLKGFYYEKPLAPFDRGKTRDEEETSIPEVGSQDRVARPGPTVRVDLPRRPT